MPRKRRRISLQWQALTSTISTTFVLILLGLVITCAFTTRRLSDSVRESFAVTVILGDDATDEQAVDLEKKLKAKPWTSRVVYISRDKALKEQTEAMGTDPSDFLGANPFSPSYELYMKPEYACTDSLLMISKMLKKNKLVADVMYQKDLVDHLNANLQRIMIVLVTLAALLLLISIVLINNTVRLSVYSRRFVIHTMKLVGASWAFICRPFLVRAWWIGLVAGVLADGVLLAALHALYGYDPSLSEFVTLNDVYITSGAVLVSGLLITLLCTFISVSHYLGLREGDLYE